MKPFPATAFPPPDAGIMGLRAHYAGLMMQALVMEPRTAHTFGEKDRAKQAVRLADALIDELKGTAR